MLGEKAYEKLSKWIISEFPTPATRNATDTISMKLLQRLSASLLFAEYPSAADAPSDLDVFWREVEVSFKILQGLEANMEGSRTGKTASPISRKKGRAATRGSQIDSRHFDAIGVSVPTTSTETRDVCARVLSELQSVLEVRRFMYDTHTWRSISCSITSSF